MKLKKLMVGLCLSGLCSLPVYASLDTHVNAIDSLNTETCTAPDWLVSSGYISPNSLAVGDTMSATISVTTACPQNSGTAPTVAVYMANSSGQLTHYFGEIGLALPYGSQISFTLTIPQMDAGIHYLVLYVDPNNVVAESNENNNVAAAQFTVVSRDITNGVTEMLDVNSSGPVTYLDRKAEYTEKFVEPQLPVTPGLTIAK